MIGLGAAAPRFRLLDTAGAPISLADLLGAPALVVFLPAPFTPVCSDELAGLARIHERAAALGASVLAIACDSMFALRGWQDWAGLSPGAPSLLSDFWPHGEVSRAYEAFDDERGIATRTSYLLDGDGFVRWRTQSAPGVGRDMDAHLAAITEGGAR